MPFVSEAQRSYLKREHPDVYRRFVADEKAMGFELKAPASVAAIASKALDMRKEHGRGGTLIGVARANQLAKQDVVSIDTIKRMVAYFDRHEADLKATGAHPGEPGYPSAGRIAWNLWGGDAGRAWARRQLAVWKKVQSQEQQ